MAFELAQLCDVRKEIRWCLGAGAAWVRSDGSFSRRRHVTTGGDARRRPVTSEREKGSETEIGCARGGWSAFSGSSRPDFPPFRLFCFIFP